MLADQSLQRRAPGGKVVQALKLPHRDEAEPVRDLFWRRIRLREEPLHLGDGGERLVERAGEQPRQLIARRQVIGLELQPRGELRRARRGLFHSDRRWRCARGFSQRIVECGQMHGFVRVLLPPFLSGAGELRGTGLRHAREVASGQPAHDDFQCAAGGIGILPELQVPVREPVQCLGKLAGVGSRLVTDFENGLLGRFQMVELVRVKFGQHHPALEIVLAFFELANDLRFRFRVFAEFDPGDGAGVERRKFVRAQNHRGVTGNRREQGCGGQPHRQPSAQPQESDRRQGHADKTEAAKVAKILTQLAFQTVTRAPDNPAQRERRPISADDAKSPRDITGVERPPSGRALRPLQLRHEGLKLEGKTEIHQRPQQPRGEQALQ